MPESQNTNKNYKNFKCLLEYFVAHLEYIQNNDSQTPGKNTQTRGYNEYIQPLLNQDFKRMGQGYNGHQIQNQIQNWEKYNDIKIFINIASNYGSYKSSLSYLNWEETAINVNALWNKNTISGLKICKKLPKENEEKWRIAGEEKIVPEITLTELGLFEKNEPNEKLKEFFDNYYNAYLKENTNSIENNMNNQTTEYIQLLETNKNLILHGAPGTGKSFLAKEIACQIYFGKKYNELSEDEKNEYESLKNFVQFHPSYDYTDFIEGLRPVKNDDGNAIGFERKDGIFKEFCKKALKNLKDSLKTPEELNEELTLQKAYKNLLNQIENGEITEIIQRSGKPRKIEEITKNGNLNFQGNYADIVSFNRLEKLAKVYKTKESLNEMKNILNEVSAVIGGCAASAYWGVLNYLYEQIESNVVEKANIPTEKKQKKDFIFIIDEINRGELSKIFGELFFSIDPGYRGNKGTVQTQYQNLVEAGDIFENGFFVPENVYIIGTMNDIDRSVESMDFAMRRRFVFKEITAEESAKNMGITGEALERMTRLNEEIKKELGSEFCIGASYFLNVANEDLQKLWDLKLSSLLREYLRGNDESDEKFKKLKNAYFDPNGTNE